MSVIDDLTLSFSRLPGIGKKSASRIVNQLLKTDDIFLLNFSKQLKELKEKIKNYLESVGVVLELGGQQIHFPVARDDGLAIFRIHRSS